MRISIAIICLVMVSAPLSHADSLEVIDLLYLSAPEFAASLAGGGGGGDAFAAEATGFALDAVGDVAMRARGRTSMPDAMQYSRARAIPGSGANLSHLLPAGLVGPPVAAPNRNALIVRGTLDAIERMREVIAMLDTPTPMVNVELTMDQIGRADSRQIDPHLQAWGWGGEASFGDRRNPVLGFRIGNLSAILGYEQGESRRHAVTATNITGMSGIPLAISAGEARPRIVSEIWYDPWGRRQVVSYPETVFAGVTLWVLPTVHADDTVTMVLRPMLSEFAGPAPQARAGDIVRSTMVETTVRVPDGQSLVIGGLDRYLDEMSRSFPASYGNMRSENNSVISVRPTIVRMRGTGR